jgi:hypothetical protein
MDADMAKALAGGGGMFDGNQTVELEGWNSDTMNHLHADALGNQAVPTSTKVVIPKVPAAARDDTTSASSAGQLSHDQVIMALRNDMKNSSEKARWFGSLLEPYEESHDLAKNMEKHARFMTAAFRRLNDAQAAKTITPEQLAALMSVCQPHFDWYASREKCAKTFERTLCPKTGVVKVAKKKVDGSAESQQSSAANAAGA